MVLDRRPVPHQPASPNRGARSAHRRDHLSMAGFAAVHESGYVQGFGCRPCETLRRTPGRRPEACTIAAIRLTGTTWAVGATLAKPGEQFYTDAGRSTSASFPDQVTISKVTPREIAPFGLEILVLYLGETTYTYAPEVVKRQSLHSSAITRG
jgi:hypothetical protein